jgi:predicted patatin/cPLA2 family phospholipase
MAFYGEIAQVTQLAGRTLERAQTYIGRQPHKKEVPVITGGPPIEHRIYDLGIERFAKSHDRLWKNLYTKKQLLDANDPAHKNIKTALIVGGGAMAGVVTAGMLEETRDRGMIDTFDIIVGVSAGAANAACILGSRTDAGVHTYTDKLTSGEFIRHGLWRPGGMNLPYVDAYLRSDEGISPAKIRAARTELRVGVVDTNGQQVLHSINELNDNQLFQAIQASCAAPYAYNQTVNLKGSPSLDGYIAGFPIEKLQAEGYDNILVMMSYPVDQILGERNYSMPEQLWIRRAMKAYPRAIRDIMISRNDKTAASLGLLLDQTTTNFSFMAPEVMHVDMMTTNRAQLLNGGTEGRRVARQQFEAHDLAHAV